MKVRSVAIVLVAGMVGGCTHAQLARSTADSAGTAMEIEYQIVMNNLARLAHDPAALPSHIRIKEGTVQVSDEWGLYNLAFPVRSSGDTLGGPRAQRKVSEQWGADAITNPASVKQLQDVYRAALGLPPLPDPPFLRAFGTSATTQSSQPSRASTQPALDLARDIPRGWFRVGTEHQVPDAARYVAHYRETWVWVEPAGMEGLGRFTLAVLFVAKAKPGEPDTGSSGLMYTGGD